METISLTVPHKEGPLRRAADMLTQLADDHRGMAMAEAPVTAVETPVTVVDEAEASVVTEVPVYVTPGAEPHVEGSGLEDGGLDSEGLPWDVRIHSDSKKKLAKTKAWKLKRNLDPAFVEQVKTELRAAPGAAAVVTEAPVVPVVTAATFESICQKITARANAQLLKTTDVPGVLAPHGLTHIGELATRPDLFVAIDAALDMLWATTPV